MHDQHRAASLAHRIDDEVRQSFLGVGLDHPMQIEMRLHRELATPQLGQQSRVESEPRAFDVLLGLGQFEGALTRDQVGQLRQDLRVLADDFAPGLRRDGQPLGPRRAQRTHALEGLAKERFLVNLRRRRNHFQPRSRDSRRCRGLRLRDRLRRWRRRRFRFGGALLDQFLKVLETATRRRAFPARAMVVPEAVDGRDVSISSASKWYRSAR